MLGIYQCGFHRGRLTTDHILMVKQIVTNCCKHQRESNMLLIEFIVAYDMISTQKSIIYRNSVSKNMQRWKIRQGLKHDDTSSKILFNIIP